MSRVAVEMFIRLWLAATASAVLTAPFVYWYSLIFGGK